jgi:hypothetical protein
MSAFRESGRRPSSTALAAALASGLLAVFLLPVRSAGGEASPDRLTFGSVRVGATVEGSVRIFLDDVPSSGVAIKVEPSGFVRVADIQIGSQDFGPNRRGFCDISVSIDTATAGSYSGELRVEIGRSRAAVPVSATVRPQMPNLTRLLVATTPISKFSTSDATVFSTWLDVVSEGHLDVDYHVSRRGLPVLRKVDLKDIDVVLLGMEGIHDLQDSDIKLLKQFTEEGGRTILSANAFFVGTVAKANQLLVPYGLRMTDGEAQDRNEFELGAAEITEDPLTEGVKTVYFHRPSPIAVTDPKKGRVLVTAPDLPGEGFVAVARAGKGEVVALGESLWWNWVASDRTKGSRNAVLLGNLLKKPRKKS